jgi:hypothetical protein
MSTVLRVMAMVTLVQQTLRWDRLLEKEHELGLNGPNESVPGEAQGSVDDLGEVLLVHFALG